MQVKAKMGLVLGVVLGSLLVGSNVQAATPQVVYNRSARNYNSQVIKSAKQKTWQSPYLPGVKAKTTTKDLSGKLVQLNRVAKTSKGTYFEISRRGHNYGWLNQHALSKTTNYRLPATYVSQLYPVKAENGCEAASLKMALSVKGKALNTSLTTLINRMPKAGTPSKGFNGNPWTASKPGEIRTIYPAPLAKYARQYDKKSANITGASTSKICTEIKRGNPVIFAGAWRMQIKRPYHVLCAIGYRNHKILVADPYMEKGWPNKTYWVSTHTFNQVYQSRHARAVVVR